MIDRIEELASPRPMVVLSLAFIIGIVLEETFQIGIILLSGLEFITVIFLVTSGKFDRRYTVLVVLVIAGALRMAVSEHQPAKSLSHFIAYPDSIYQVSAIVQGAGETKKGTPKYLLLPLSIGEQDFSYGRIILYSREMANTPEIGDTLTAGMELFKPRSKRNPNDFDYARYLRSQNIFFEAFLQDPQQIKLTSNTTLLLRQMIVELKESIKAFFYRHMQSQSAGILSALILGERGEVEEDIRNDFANTGVIHVLAVSGLHVAYVSLVFITLIGLFRFPYAAQSILVALGLAFYVILTGGAASVMRASIMAILLLMASVLERKSDIFNTLATAAFIILIIDPNQVFSIGFQLSFSAVLSIVLLFPVLKAWIPHLDTGKNFIIGRSINSVIDLFLVSLAAQLGTLAITIYYFHKIPIVSLFANLLVVPLIGLIVATGMSMLLIGSLFPILAEYWAVLLDTVIAFMLWFVSVCAGFDWAYISTRSISVHEVIILLTAIFLLAGMKIQKLFRLWLILILLWMDISTWGLALQPPVLEVSVLDVGQGDAVIIHTPNHKTMVVDAGLGFGGKDMGKDVISPYLKYRNWDRIDLLVLTHPHNDHIGGAPYLLEHHPVQRVLMQEVTYDSYTYEKLLSILDSLEIPVQSAYTGMIDSSMAPAIIRISAPKKFNASTQPTNINNVSITFQLFYGNTTMLFTGDAEQEVETDQLVLGSLLKSDLLKVPHHGSRTSSSARFLELVKPEIGLISVGTKNKYKHPAPITLRHYKEWGIEVRRTDLEGAICYESDGESWKHVDWKTEP
ncbi:MAG: DNA internalization-related competence protein ComEC/Rec2 [Candidatus Marinimicrobia bacterium]|nr:DNA internalization-related competence protein ComEC/Rec2 [Candidatus Neomarinimicrobiota bacterium]